jgi:hypothetical protein
MSAEVARCTKCGHIASHDYIKGRNQWYCETCHKVVRIEWREPPTIWYQCENCTKSVLKGSLCKYSYRTISGHGCNLTPMETEPVEPQDGLDVPIDIDAFQERMNQIP